jgi:hypothetical protein
MPPGAAASHLDFALHWHPGPPPCLIPARARSSASSHLATSPYPAHASSRPASAPYPCRAHRRVSSRLRAALASRARPAASPHPDCPPFPAPRLITASLPAAAASRPDSGLHWHPGPPRPSPRLARLSPRPRAFGLEQDITRPPCLWVREGVWATRITSAKPAAAPHPAPPPRLILTNI